MTIGKIWYEVERRDREGDGPDLVLVDAPATGTASSTCACRGGSGGVPGRPRPPRGGARAVAAARSGRDRGRDGRDGRGACRPTRRSRSPRSRDDLGLRGSLLVVNRMHAAPVDGRGRRGAARGPRGERRRRPAVQLRGAVLARAEDEASWAEINAAMRSGWRRRCRRRRSRCRSLRRGVRLRRGRELVGQSSCARRRERARPGNVRSEACSRRPDAPRAMSAATVASTRSSSAPDVVVCAGSGGVGKTTTAASVALWGALRGRRASGADDRPRAPSRGFARSSDSLGGAPGVTVSDVARAGRHRGLRIARRR